MTNSAVKAFKGTFFHTKVYGTLDVLEDAVIFVDADGVITDIVTDTVQADKLLADWSAEDIVSLDKGQYFLPGFIDTHIHAPQWPQSGVALDEPLEVWLQEKTFPLEAKFADNSYAKKVYTDLVQTLLANGTTTALYFATIHKESSYELARICAEMGQRALVGKVVADNPAETPDYYRDESTAEALADSEDFILKVKALGEGLKQGIYPVVTPRFVPSCTEEALAGLGALAQKYHVHVQSHISESDWQHHFAQEQYGKRDAEVLRDAGLFGKKSVMAHGTYLNDYDADILADTHTGVAHCPISNVYFGDAVTKVQLLKAHGVDVGLGSDISGGFSPSLYDNVRQAVMSQRQAEHGVDTEEALANRLHTERRVSVVEAFYLATTGGGEALDLPIGKFEKGYAFDAQVIDTQATYNSIQSFDEQDSLTDTFERIIYRANTENVKQVYVQGDLVHTRGAN